MGTRDEQCVLQTQPVAVPLCQASLLNVSLRSLYETAFDKSRRERQVKGPSADLSARDTGDNLLHHNIMFAPREYLSLVAKATIDFHPTPGRGGKAGESVSSCPLTGRSLLHV